ncbi:MAG: fibronectin type III domain-containing protein [Chitinophagaceae bacterium]|nr:fibronectin type III domain-containing protein [Chitinophagaceae bacterium]
MRKAFLSLAILLSIAGGSFAQLRNCGTMDHLNWLQQQDPNLAQRMHDIENATQTYIASNGGETRTVITIPVVVHVLYNTTAQNISDAQVQAQINQLNADYARLNSDAGNTPSVWQSIAANCEVQFCLAQRDPSGAATNGIIRKSTTKTSFLDTGDPAKHNSTGGDDAWPAASYLNLWSCNLGGGLLGYAQFPGGAAATDGVVVLYSSIGSIAQPGTAAPYNYGRTLTHEVGHWLNLYHIWGDDGTACTGSDQVSDTPNQADENYGCPVFPNVSCSNGPNGDMFMNYMDYTDDACMNMFSAGQKTRMQALFGTGGTRVSLTTSLGCTPPSTSCGTPAGLSSSAITSSSATVSWSAVSGATSYNVQYKLSGSSTWTTTTSTTTSKALSGLTASTTYNYQVQAVCASGTSAYSTALSFTTSASGGITYCASNGISQTYEYIDLVSLGSISRTSGADAGGYYNGTASSTTVNKGSAYTITTSGGFTGSTYAEQWAVFCDWNADGDFTDAGETAASFSSSTAANNTATITIPSTASTASTRMRVSMKYGAAPTSCESFAEGEVEDYTLNIQPGSGGGCAETFEPNNTTGTAAAATVGIDITSQISTSTDQDWYSFANTSTLKNIKVTLTTLPGDYDIKLFNPGGTNVKTSQNGGTTSETIIYNSTTVGTYKIQVYGYNGALSASSCYTMHIYTSATAFRFEEGAQEAVTVNTDFQVYPNPVADNMTLQFASVKKGDALLNVYNLLGQKMYSTSVLALEGDNLFNLNVSEFTNGTYIAEVINNGAAMRKQFVVTH